MKAFIFELLILLIGFNQSGFNQSGFNQTTLKASTSIKKNMKVFKWNYESCDYTGKYDSTFIKYKQLINTYDLFFTDRFRIQTKTFAFKIEEISELNVGTLDCECKRKIKDLETLDILGSKSWKDLKESKLKELKKECELSKLGIIAYTNPDTLSYVDSQSGCKKYVDGLIKGGDELLKIVTDIVKNDVFLNQFNSVDKYKYAQNYVIICWLSCVNPTIPRMDYEQFNNEFKKVFIEIKEDCTEP